MAAHILTQDELKSKLHYNPDTGIFTHIPKKRNKRKTLIAGFKSSETYLCIGLQGKYYKLHRLAWLYVYGSFPSNSIDHINGIRDDNRICNLREATACENGQNIAKYSCNTTGYIGVSYYKKLQKFGANIQVNKTKVYIGLFFTAELAHEAYLEYKLKLHKFNPEIRHSHTAILHTASAHSRNNT